MLSLFFQSEETSLDSILAVSTLISVYTLMFSLKGLLFPVQSRLGEQEA